MKPLHLLALMGIAQAQEVASDTFNRLSTCQNGGRTAYYNIDKLSTFRPDPSVVTELNRDATFTLSKCIYSNGRDDLVVDGTSFSNSSNLDASSGFGCIATLNGEDCEYCKSCVENRGHDPFIVKHIQVMFDCSNVKEGCAAADFAETCAASGEQAFGQCDSYNITDTASSAGNLMLGIHVAAAFWAAVWGSF